MEYLDRKFPALERITCYATAQDILRREVDQLKALKGLKLGIVYMGVESGNDAVLALTLTLVSGTPMCEKNCRGDFSLISPVQSFQELKTIIENAKAAGLRLIQPGPGYAETGIHERPVIKMISSQSGLRRP